MRAIPLIWLDATYVKCRREGRAASTAAVMAIDCDESGWRRVLGVSVPAAPRDRGAAGTELVVSDAPGGWSGL